MAFKGNGLVEIKFDQRKLNNIRRQMSGYPGALEKIMPRAINKTAKSIRTKAARGLSQITGLSVKTLRDRFHINPARGAFWFSNIFPKGGSIPLIKMGARQTKAGVSYKSFKGGGRQLVGGGIIEGISIDAKETFINTRTDTGKKAVLWRVHGEQYPVWELFGPSTAELMSDNPALLDRLTREAVSDLERNISVQVALVLQRARGAA